MPLFKRTAFSLVDTPKDLCPNELVYQVRFTKEIFKDYASYLKRLNLYRQRLWSCKLTGKSNLTYEEALVSEKLANEKVQQFPKELIAPVLRMVQFSTLRLKDIVDNACKKLQGSLSEGDQLYGKKDDSVVCPCKILEVQVVSGKTLYKVEWINKDKSLNDTSVVKAEDLIRKRLPFTREALKGFIKESTSQSFPWIIHEKLAKKYGISTELPKELQEEIPAQGITHSRNKITKKQNDQKSKGKEETKKVTKKQDDQKRKRKEETGNSKSTAATKKVKKGKEENRARGKIHGRNKVKKKQDEVCQKKRKRQGTKNSESMAATKKVKKEKEKPPPVPIKYPIEDLLVQPTADDPVFTDRPSPSRDFTVPVDCVGDLLMIWDFCSTFNRMLRLWPFSLEDLQNAICHKDSNLVLIVESHSAILHLLIKDEGEYFTAIQNKNRSGKISAVNWTNYLCDFIEMQDAPELSAYLATIKRGHYGLLTIRAKLDILRQLVSEALVTDITREQLVEFIEQRQARRSRKRGEALEEGREKKETEPQGVSSKTKEVKGHSVEDEAGNVDVLENGHDGHQNGHLTKGDKDPLISSSKNISGNRKFPGVNGAAKETAADQNGAKESLIDEDKGGANIIAAKKNKEQRKNSNHREMVEQLIRTNSLGKDKNYNRYWFFARDGRIFVESPDSKLWGYYGSTEELDALIGSLNPKGVRERALQNRLRKNYKKMCLGLQKRSKFIAHKIAMEEAVVRRSTRVQAPRRDNPAHAFLNYANKWNTK